MLTVNFSGSTGFGSEFNNAIASKIGEKDIEEIIAFLDYFKEYYNKEEMYYWGWSYSGYLGAVFL